MLFVVLSMTLAIMSGKRHESVMENVAVGATAAGGGAAGAVEGPAGAELTAPPEGDGRAGAGAGSGRGSDAAVGLLRHLPFGGVEPKMTQCPCRSGGIGRRARLRAVWGDPCRFESGLRHHRS